MSTGAVFQTAESQIPSFQVIATTYPELIEQAEKTVLGSLWQRVIRDQKISAHPQIQALTQEYNKEKEKLRHLKQRRTTARSQYTRSQTGANNLEEQEKEQFYQAAEGAAEREYNTCRADLYQMQVRISNFRRAFEQQQSSFENQPLSVIDWECLYQSHRDAQQQAISDTVTQRYPIYHAAKNDSNLEWLEKYQPLLLEAAERNVMGVSWKHRAVCRAIEGFPQVESLRSQVRAAYMARQKAEKRRSQARSNYTRAENLYGYHAEKTLQRKEARSAQGVAYQKAQDDYSAWQNKLQHLEEAYSDGKVMHEKKKLKPVDRTAACQAYREAYLKQIHARALRLVLDGCPLLVDIPPVN